jgi:sialic acid synthase SpsE/sugar phosphate isomerase/epimerase/CBS domain-containing protein
MTVDHDISALIVFSEDDIVTALRKVNANKRGVVLCVSGSGQLQGVLTDGDVRRWIVAGGGFGFDTSALAVANRDFTAVRDGADEATIRSHFSERVSFVPIVDAHNHLKAVAWRDSTTISIAGRAIGPGEPAYVIAEIGNNHNGSLDLAKQLIDLAVEAGADCAKFQMRDMSTLYRNGGASDDESADLGAQYTLDLLSRFQLKDHDLMAAFDYCKERGIQPLCTPFDESSLAKLEAYGMPAYKLASADLTNHTLLTAMARTGKVLICSTGMSSQAEVEDAIALLKRQGAPFVMLHCNSTYPAPFKDINLAYMDTLAKTAEGMVGYSGHERGISVPIAAVARGARVIEKHFTLDREMEGNDHRVSLLPGEFGDMVRAIREVEESIGTGRPRSITQGELMNREVLAKSIVAAGPILEGQVIGEEDLAQCSPGQGLQPYRRAELIGRRARRSMSAGDVFFPSDLSEGVTKARDFHFKRPFGVPVRYHDLRKMVAASNLDLVEFHLSYKDMEVNIADALKGETFDVGLVVHSPELFAGDHVMDLCSSDAVYRQRSIDELQRVIDITRDLTPYFTKACRPPIIINAGGFSADGPIPVHRRAPMYDLVAEALATLDKDGVEIIPQTMPPYPWHFGGQRYHNLFMAADEIAEFCATHDYRICLDISHSALAATHTKTNLRDFLEQIGHLTCHLHIVDAEGVDGEGLQIGDGAVDFAMVAAVLADRAPAASFIPEIWQGHKDEGSGFWTALERLEQWF